MSRHLEASTHSVTRLTDRLLNYRCVAQYFCLPVPSGSNTINPCGCCRNEWVVRPRLLLGGNELPRQRSIREFRREQRGQ